MSADYMHNSYVISCHSRDASTSVADVHALKCCLHCCQKSVTFGCLSAILLAVITRVTLGLGGTDEKDHLAGNFPVKLQNIRV